MNDWTCSGCERRFTSSASPVATTCWECEARDRLQALPPDVRSELDALLHERLFIQAMMRVHAHQRVLGIHGADAVVQVRLAELGIPRHLPPPTLAELATRVEQLGTRPVAIEAFWDGDTDGWIAVLAS